MIWTISRYTRGRISSQTPEEGALFTLRAIYNTTEQYDLQDSRELYARRDLLVRQTAEYDNASLALVDNATQAHSESDLSPVTSGPGSGRSLRDLVAPASPTRVVGTPVIETVNNLVLHPTDDLCSKAVNCQN